MPVESSNIHPIALVFTLAMGILLFLLPRRAAIVPLLAGTLFVPLGQQILILSLHFYMFRILIAFGVLRVRFRGEHKTIKFNKIDGLVVAYGLAFLIFAMFRSPTIDMLVRRLGFVYDLFGIYYLMRILIQDSEDIRYTLKTLALLCIPIAMTMLVELTTGRNLFSVFGGVPEYTAVRDGKIRCQGPFLHPILAGDFAAALIPLFLYLAWERIGPRKVGLLGVFFALVIVGNTGSSGPVGAMIAGIFAMAMWPLRKRMRLIRWGLLLSAISLHIVMKAPVWALLYRTKFYGSSSEYHRFNLLDQFIRRIDEWWLFGIKSTAHWGWMMQDVANMFVRQGVDGGIVTLILFLAIIIYCFKGIGNSMAASAENLDQKHLSWALGASLFTHIVAFLSVSYFDQVIVIWFMLLAVISTVSTMNTVPTSVKHSFGMLRDVDYNSNQLHV